MIKLYAFTYSDMPTGIVKIGQTKRNTVEARVIEQGDDNIIIWSSQSEIIRDTDIHRWLREKGAKKLTSDVDPRIKGNEWYMIPGDVAVRLDALLAHLEKEWRRLYESYRASYPLRKAKKQPLKWLQELNKQESDHKKKVRDALYSLEKFGKDL